jgi:7-carboxy-7-deazaguanine synthase
MSKRIPIVELFGPTLQGEGALAGQISAFVRSGGCQARCSWCDSPHAVLPTEIKRNARYMEATDIVSETAALFGTDKQRNGRPWVTLTGGDPCLWDYTPVVAGFYGHGLRTAVETQGWLWREWLTSCDLVTCSPKPPSSGMADRVDFGMLQKYAARLGDRLFLKFVVFDESDLDWAARIRKLSPKTRVFLSAGTPLGAEDLKSGILASYKWLTEKVLQCPEWYDATVLPQLHALLWGRELGR